MCINSVSNSAVSSDPSCHKLTLCLDLSGIWHAEVAAGAIANDFVAEFDDPDSDRDWKSGDRLKVGLWIKSGKPEYYAINLTENKPIFKKTLSEVVPGAPSSHAPFSKLLIPFRSLRAKALAVLVPGPQPVRDCSAAGCGFYCCSPSSPSSVFARSPVSLVKLGHLWAIYHNWSPFVFEGGHMLVFPAVFDPEARDRLVLPHMPQRMRREWLADSVTLAGSLSSGLVIWNSPGAGGASQPGHAHFQLCFNGKPLLPIQLHSVPEGMEYCYLQDYPVNALAFGLPSGPANLLWQCINSLEAQCVPYNLIMDGTTAYVVPRNSEWEVTPEAPFGVWGSYEMAGRLIFSNASNYFQMDYETMLKAYSKCGLSRERIFEITGLL